MPLSDKMLRRLTGYRLQRATSAATVGYKAVFAQFGLRRTTFSCLSLIVENPGLRQSQLGETLAIERPNLVNIVDDLTKSGLIVRNQSDSDRRAYALTPTDKGQALYHDAMQAVEDMDAAMTAGLSAADVKLLQSALSRIENNAGKKRSGPDR